MTPRVARLIDRGVALLSVTVLAAQKQDWPTGWWALVNTAAPWNTLALLLLSGIFSFSPLSARVDRKQVPAREAERRKILNTYGSLLEMATQCGLSISDPALHVWKTGRLKAKRLVTYRLSDAVHLRTFAPKKGFGVVGLCWRDAEEKGVDVESLASRVTSQATFETVARANPDEVMNFDWSEFVRLKHRGAVFASPIVRNEQVIGIVSFDASSQYADLSAAGVPGELNKLSAALASSLEVVK